MIRHKIASVAGLAPGRPVSVNDYDYPLYVDLLKKISEICLGDGLKIAVESDFSPLKLEAFMRDIGSSFVGVNYDIGNGASLGFDFLKRWRRLGLIS